MIPQRKSFELPMTVTFAYYQEAETGKMVAHALDFDLVCSGNSEEEVTSKIRLAVKTYIEYGLSKNWAGDILFPAPSEYWDGLTDAQISFAEPICVMDRRMLVYRVLPSHGLHQYPRAAIQAC